jgi:hypothetical protein
MDESSENPAPPQKRAVEVTNNRFSRGRFFKAVGGLLGLAAVNQIADRMPPPKTDHPLSKPSELKITLLGQDDPAEQIDIADNLPKEDELTPFDPKLTVIDAGHPNAHGENQRTAEDVSQRVLGTQYISKEQLVKEFGEDYEKKWDEIREKYPQTLVNYYLEFYFEHGDSVSQVLEEVWKRDKLKANTIGFKGLQSLFGPESYQPVVDVLGNKGVSLQFDEQKIIELLKDDQNKVVNMSFQVGDVQIFKPKRFRSVPEVKMPKRTFALNPDNLVIDDADEYYILRDGEESTRSVLSNGKQIPLDPRGNQIKPINREEYRVLLQQRVKEAEAKAKILDNPISLEINGAYTKEKAEKNLPKLFAVANAYPDKLFVVAAGNEGEDLREALIKFKDLKPKNLLIVAELKGELYPKFVHGADIYFNNRQHDLPGGSSFSTTVISATAAEMRARGLTIDETINEIKSYCRPQTNFVYSEKVEDETVSVFYRGK